MVVLRVLMGRDWTRDTITRSAVGMLFTTVASMQQTVENALEPSAAPQGAATELRTLSYSAYSIHDVHLAATRRECITHDTTLCMTSRDGRRTDDTGGQAWESLPFLWKMRSILSSIVYQPKARSLALRGRVTAADLRRPGVKHIYEMY